MLLILRTRLRQWRGFGHLYPSLPPTPPATAPPTSRKTSTRTTPTPSARPPSPRPPPAPRGRGRGHRSGHARPGDRRPSAIAPPSTSTKVRQVEGFLGRAIVREGIHADLKGKFFLSGRAAEDRQATRDGRGLRIAAI